MPATITALTSQYTVDELCEAVEEIEESISECAAEYGMGAVSMGFSPYEIPPYQVSEKTAAFLAEAKARIMEAYSVPPVITISADPTDLPF